MSAAQRYLDGAQRTRSTESTRHSIGNPGSFHAETDEYTAWIRGQDEEDVRRLLERAGAYRRKWDYDRRCWKIPVGDLDAVRYAARRECRIFYVDGAG